MGKTFRTAAEAIAHSTLHTEIAYCENREANRDFLLSECDDYVEGDMTDEYWKNDESTEAGMEWRVHIDFA